MNYKATLDFLFGSLPMYQKQGTSAFKKDLTNIISLCVHLGNPQDDFPSVHVGGTNGKGSTAHSIAAIMQQAGYKVGLYTSPHLKDFTERIKINGQPISQVEVIDFVTNHKPFIDEIKPSFFEMTVALAFDYFSLQQVDIAIIEVGLGGRLDSTNIINPLVSVITNIGLDHTEMLGDTLEKIAGEKAGIIKPNTPVVISEYQEEVAEVFKAKAEATKSQISFADQELFLKHENSGFDVYSMADRLLVSTISPDLKGRFHLKNIPGIVATVLTLQKLGFSVTEKAITKGLNNTKAITNFKGRWQKLQDQPTVICDIGHNVAGVKEIVAQLTDVEFESLHVVWGMVKDKNTEEVLRLLPKTARYYFCQAQIPRALDADVLLIQALAIGLQGERYDLVNQAIHAALSNAKDNDMIFIGGSTFVVAEIEDL